LIPAPRIPVRAAAEEVARRLADAGHAAFFAGGCVRDQLLGSEPEDYDIATDARPEQIQAVFPKARGVGEAFGVMLVRAGGHTFEVATFRKDGPYHDGRRPASVTFSDAFADANRRDFTVNGLFQDPRTGEIVDHVNGRPDIAARSIRAIGDPHERIAEDRLRMLRAVRFAARLGFTIDPATSAAVRTHAGELRSVSPERVGDEVRKMLAHPARARAARLVESHELDGAIFGDVVGADVAGRLDHQGAEGDCPRLATLSTAAPWTTALAAWLLDRLARGGADLPARTPPRPDAAEVSRRVAALRARLVLSNHETDALHALLAAREAMLGDFASLPLARRMRWMAAPGFDAALDILRVEDPDRAAALRSEADRELPARRLPEPLVDGNTLVSEGLRPGPEFKVLLDLAMDAQLEGRVASRAEALDLVHRSRTGGNHRP
jgi:poly(A) polymerase